MTGLVVGMEPDSIVMGSISFEALTEEADDLLKRLFPICRSITGEGVRQSLAILQEVVDFEVHEISSGTVCYDWVVPDEWNVSEAYIQDSQGRTIADFRDNNLHLVSYSMPIDRVVSFQELSEHLHTLPDLPDAVPYRTSYYKRDWGFCLSYKQFERLDTKANYHVYINATLNPGGLTFGETAISGHSGKEFLLSTYSCHPSLANDNLSGMVLWTLLLRELKSKNLRHSYRAVIVPETIGAIAYLSQHEAAMKCSSGGFVITTVAGPGRFGYKQTFLGNHLIDRAVQRTFAELDRDYSLYPFDVKGSDETHYSAPYFRIPVGTICKDKYYEYPFYHTSLDNLQFINARHLVQTLELYLLTIEKLELNRTYRSLSPYSEPMLGQRGLYPSIGGHINQPAVDGGRHSKRDYALGPTQKVCGQDLDAMLWVLFYGDGKTSLLDVAEKIGFPIRQLYRAAERLCAEGLLEEVSQNPGER